MKCKLISISIIFLFIFQVSFANALSITTEKETYHYGDYLTFTITVDEVTGDLAILYVVDANGKKSSPIALPLSELVTVQTSPFPFEKMTYPEGKWSLEIEYEGILEVAEFNIKDSGQISIPTWIRDVGKMWANNLITEVQFASSIEFLINENIINVPNVDKIDNNSLAVPPWLKISTGWWAQGLVSDQEYANLIEFLIKKEIIKV